MAGRIVKLPPCVCDVPGGTSNVQLPRFHDDDVLKAVYIVGRTAEDVRRIVVRVNGLCVLDFRPYVDDEGIERTGGELAKLLQAMRGIGPDKLVLPLGLALWKAEHVVIEIGLSDGAEPCRTQLFAKLAR